MKKRNILVIVAVILLAICLAVGVFVYGRINKMQHAKLDKENLGIEDSYTEAVANKVENIEEKEVEKVRNILLLGSDTRNSENMHAGRTDSMMILSINPVSKKINLISIPRDTYVEVEGHGKTKLNHAFAYGKEQLLIKTINQNFGLNIAEFVTIDFVGVANIVDYIGGIEMEITEEERTYINYNLGEVCKMRKSPKVKVEHSGVVTLDGNQALTYARDRVNGNDFTRQERQRKVLMKISEKVSTMNIASATAFLDVCLKEVTTNINVAEYVSLIPSILANKDSYMQNLNMMQFPNAEFAAGQKINGVYYFVPFDMENTKNKFAEIIYK